ncbi:hypothetical protein [Pseudocitrobacter faecalis]|uniref:hypothetical protein n=1 Tax=Pseudocitrobacter faecalis TaxID=1398493 RepID=UPI0016776144|nr:hypothetical protein [Pseudocitrobacter faecalis]UYW72948.1 hypothetical protein OFY05_15745 [Pseudocitrobacter faecalis]GHD97116.1 hypothetical protein GCM10011445_39230 [Pseudocitrobacter faecalis]
MTILFVMLFVGLFIGTGVGIIALSLYKMNEDKRHFQESKSDQSDEDNNKTIIYKINHP